MEGTFHRRQLLPPSISFSSKEGRALFTSALADGTMESYFRMAEQYSTQAHPSFCGIGSLSMALNALLVDPQRVWQGVWRFYYFDQKCGV
jgi:glutathione gamma-glutamylcysteinyltransferase